MKRLLVFLCTVLFFSGVVGIGHAELIDNADGTVTQIQDDGSALMWMKDANAPALTSGSMNWSEAMAWAGLLEYGGHDDWRLPDSPATIQGFVNEGEMGHLYYTELGNPAGGPRINSGPFINIPPPSTAVYWLSAEPLHPGSAWSFSFNSGNQNAESDVNGHYAWAVRDLGEAPEPPFPYWGVVMGDGPFAYYRLGESVVTDPVVDEMGNHNGSCQNNPTVGVTGALLSDPANTAICFDSSQSQYIELTTLGDYGSGLTEGFTVEYWLKTTDPTAVQSFLGSIRKKDIPSDPYFRSNFFIAIGDLDNYVRLYFRDDNWRRYAVSSHPEDRTVDIFDGQWHHMVHVYDPTGILLEDRMLWYVDGVPQTLEIQLLGAVPSDFSNFNVPMILAAQNFRGEIRDHLNGCLDEVAFYTRPLSEEEVLSHYQAAISAYITVDIDIKPGSDPNSINPRSKGVVPVAILTTDTFDATTLDPLSVAFGPDGATEAHGQGHIEDIDGDSDLDLVLHFKIQDTGIACGDTSASLTGETFGGEPIEGSDSVNTVGCS